MNVQTHLSGQISGQIPNQTNNQLSGLSQHNGSSISNRIPSLGANRSTMNSDSEIIQARRFVQEKIKEFIMQRQQNLPNLSEQRVIDIVRRIDDTLWRSSTKEEYMNLDTLAKRIHALITRLPSSNHNQQRHPQHVSSLSSGTMMPTPGMPAPMVSTAGSIPRGYQQSPANFSGNNVSSTGAQQASQMIPTPGFSSSNNNPTLVNVNLSNGVNSFSTVESTMLPQPVMQKSGQNTRMLHNLRSNLQQKAYGFANGAFGEGLGMTQNNLQMLNGLGTSSDGYRGATQFAEQMVRGDGYRTDATDSSEPGNFYGTNNQNWNPTNLSSISRTNSGMVINGSNLQASQQAMNILPPINQYENTNFPSQESLSLPHPQQQSQQPPYQLQQIYQQQRQSKQENQQHQDISSSMVQTSQQMQHILNTQNDFNFNGMQSGRVVMATNSDTKFQNLQEDFRQRMNGQDQAHRNNCPADVARTTDPANSVNPSRERQYKNQCRWILLMLHARRCIAPEGNCQEVHCVKAQQLLKHMNTCNLSQCKFPRCQNTKMLVKHRTHCRDTACPVCIPVKIFLEKQKDRPRVDSKSPQVNESIEDLQTSLKRVKMEKPFQNLVPEGESFSISAPSMVQSHVSISAQEYAYNDPFTSMKPEIKEVKLEIGSICNDLKKGNIDGAYNQKAAKEPVIVDGNKENTKSEAEADQYKTESSVENATGTKSGKPKIKGVSLIELFTPEQVREHIRGLRQWVGQSKSKAEKNQAMEHSMNENSCQLCAVEKLTFEPAPIYCTPCGARIKRNAMYYTIRAGDTQHYFCIPCYNEVRGDSIPVDGTAMPKAKMEKKKNDEETEEWWVQCDKCEAWQHQICALFNGRRNDGGDADYTCPNCYVDEVEKGERNPLPQSAVLGAKDLPRTILSDHIEQRLFKRLKQERQDRARFQGKSYDEVPGAEGLVVRVVSSVDKKLEVKQRFLEIFQEENYPTEIPYKSKVVLLFQRSEGVEVCLFAMYVQEFGSECDEPNHRRVYLSYLDSVKYFRPEIRTVTGEALRTFVYHEILIGYLDYCKKRGFTSCYIWACPPLKGEDYILYCHPEIQKTPKSDKLREWYLSMLKKATKENIVVELTNLYDHFFVSYGECKAKVTATRLPYFDGDYWPGAAEDMILQLQQEEDGRKQLKKGLNKKILTKRALKASGQTDLSGNVSKDLLLMHKLGETIAPMKEDFIMVHLQHSCSHCCLLIVFGHRWVCNQCKNFQLCDRCYEAEQRLEDRERHPVNRMEKHLFRPVEIKDVPEDTKDKDDILESEFFDTRQTFLSLCQGNHYQYDTLRRAKHSSMMVLYHLHNPTAPAFVITCLVCYRDIPDGQGWRCETCPDYDVCNSCYQNGGIDHPHELTNHPTSADRNAQNKEARQQRVVQLRKMLDLLVHASQCRSSSCQYPNCRKVKGLFRHGMQCKTRASGGCSLCKKMWELLQLHARTCKESQCFVPRCRDLKEHMRRLQKQSDSRRRAAVMEMMRQRAAEVAGNSG